MTTLNEFDRQLLVDMLRRNGMATILSELAWLQIQADLTKRVQGPQLQQVA